VWTYEMADAGSEANQQAMKAKLESLPDDERRRLIDDKKQSVLGFFTDETPRDNVVERAMAKFRARLAERSKP
jgi:hypothetical protein